MSGRVSIALVPKVYLNPLRIGSRKERQGVLKGEKQASLLFLLPPFDYSYPIDTRWQINFVRHFYEYKKTKNCITKKRASGFRTCNVMS